MATFRNGVRVDAPSDRHFEILASHGMADQIPQDRLEKAMSDAAATQAAQKQKLGNLFSGIFSGLKDNFDGGGKNMAGARFARGDVSMFDTNNDKYISETEFQNAEVAFPDIYQSQVAGGIPALSNVIGARPYGSYAQEESLGNQGTNIGTTGIAGLLTNGGITGAILNQLRGRNMGAVNPNLPLGMRLGSVPRPQLRPPGFFPQENPAASVNTPPSVQINAAGSMPYINSFGNLV